MLQLVDIRLRYFYVYATQCLQADILLASCLIYSYALAEYINRFDVDRMVTFFTMLLSVKFAEEKMLVVFILREKC